ncbi:MAG: DNA polymerase III subunit delta', partial [Candidatus Omnitrophota bacterium]
MSFAQIKGQDLAITTLKKCLLDKRFASGYLFSGPSGVGKSLAAKNFAKAINCLEQNLDACDKCISCQKIDKNNHPDIHFLENDEFNSIKIDEVRSLQKDLN